jgi:GT2 family glycosyltransferase
MSDPAAPTVLSVVIPTYNRLEILRRALGLLAEAGNAFGVPHEVLVVDDGSSDGTAAWLAGSGVPKAATARFRAIGQENAGPARARNRGVEEATGNLVLFLGDDVLVTPGLLALHVEAHRTRSAAGEVAILGRTLWAPEMRPTAFLRFLMEGDQFGFKHIEDHEHVPYNFFYTANVSLRRQAMLDAGLFDESFPHAAWEDVELCYRMTRDGMRLVYEPRALAHHLHPTSLASFCRRRELVGLSAVRLFRKHPETEKMLCFDWFAAEEPARWKKQFSLWFKQAYAVLEQRRLDRGPLLAWRFFFRRLSYYHYFKGVRQGLALEREGQAGAGPGEDAA